MPQTIETPHGTARVHVHPVAEPVGAIVLGHGAAGSVTARDLVAVADVAHEAAVNVALVEQPYRVAGRRAPAPAHQLDAAWIAVVAALRADALRGPPLVVGGRSSGARVACRTAEAVGAAAVLCLAFPLHPPGRPLNTRQPELDAVRVPTLVVQGERDPFGRPGHEASREVVLVRGNHSLNADLDAVAAAVRAWLPAVLCGG